MDRVVAYLSRFTGWHPVAYEMGSFNEDRLLPFPITLNGYEAPPRREAITQESRGWLEEVRASQHGNPGFWQPFVQVNYPNDHDFTRIVEIKHATGQRCENTTIVREYPRDYEDGAEPYYPIPAPDTEAIYARYRELAEREESVSFIGRLARYRYYNMDQVVAMALKEAERLGPV